MDEHVVRGTPAELAQAFLAFVEAVKPDQSGDSPVGRSRIRERKGSEPRET